MNGHISLDLKNITYIFSILFCLFLTGTGIFLLTLDYHTFVVHLLESYGKLDKIEAFKAFISPVEFQLLSIAFLLTGALGVYLCFKYKSVFINIDKHVTELSVFVYQHYLWAKQFISSLSVRERWALWLIMAYIVVSRTYLATQWPLMLDEAFSYLFFVKKGFFVIITYYPGPNNHIFYNLLCWPFELLLNTPVWIMRIPGLVLGFLVPLLSFIWLRNRFDTWLAFLSLTVISLPFNLTIYSFLGRGYMVQLLLMLFTAYCFFKYLKTDNRLYRLLFIIGSVLGFFTIPTFLYPWISMWVLAAVIYNKFVVVSLRQLLRLIFTVGFLTFLCYLPVLIISGPKLLFGNSWIQPLPFDGYFSEWLWYLDSYFNNLWNMDENGWIVSLVVVILAISLRKYLFFMEKVPAWDSWLKAWALIILMPLVLIFIQRVLPFQRVWLYVVLFNSVMAVFVFYIWLRRLEFTEWHSFAVWILIALLVDISYWHEALKKGYGVYDYVDRFTTEVVESSPKKVLITDDTYFIFTRYESEMHHTPFKVETTVSPGEYDWVVVPLGKDWPEGLDESKYNWTYHDPQVKAYRLKKNL